MCDEVVDNAVKMKEQIRQVEEKEQEKVQKKKTRKFARQRRLILRKYEIYDIIMKING